MLKHIKPKDIVEFLAFALGVAVLIILAGFLESAPLHQAFPVAIFLALLLWAAWSIIVIRQRKVDAGRPKLKMYRNGEWLDVAEIVASRSAMEPYDQDADAIKHLDINTQEKA